MHYTVYTKSLTNFHSDVFRLIPMPSSGVFCLLLTPEDSISRCQNVWKWKLVWFGIHGVVHKSWLIKFCHFKATYNVRVVTSINLVSHSYQLFHHTQCIWSNAPYSSFIQLIMDTLYLLCKDSYPLFNRYHHNYMQSWTIYYFIINP